jgi:hypothetical protein
VTLDQVKGSIAPQLSPDGRDLTVTLGAFPIKTSSKSKLIAIVTDVNTGTSKSLTFDGQKVGTTVQFENLDGGTTYRVDLKYISTTGVVKLLSSKTLGTPVTKPLITNNNSDVKVQSNGNNSSVRVYIGKVVPSSTPKPVASKKPVTASDKTQVRVYIGKAEK